MKVRLCCILFAIGTGIGENKIVVFHKVILAGLEGQLHILGQATRVKQIIA